jgi:hypothetical protein
MAAAGQCCQRVLVMLWLLLGCIVPMLWFVLGVPFDGYM